MELLWLLVCLTYCGLAYPQEDEAARLEKDIQEFVRRFSHQQMPTTQDMQSPYMPRPREVVQSEDEILDPFLALNFPLRQGNVGRAGAYASSYASAKRPSAGVSAQASAGAYASARDVDAEENLEEKIESSERLSTLSVTNLSPPEQAKTTLRSSIGSTGPQTMKQQQQVVQIKDDEPFSDVYFVAIVAGCCAVGIFGVISAGFCFYKLQKSRKAAADVDYPAYGVTGPCKDVTSPNGDRKLAQSAQMYHYQHQKQQMIAVEKAGSTKNTSASDVDSEEENEEGDYTVYECPGLAPTGEMEVKNPLFHDDSTPVSPPVLPSKPDNIHSN